VNGYGRNGAVGLNVSPLFFVFDDGHEVCYRKRRCSLENAAANLMAPVVATAASINSQRKIERYRTWETTIRPCREHGVC
jgi:hypothetical protein